MRRRGFSRQPADRLRVSVFSVTAIVGALLVIGCQPEAGPLPSRNVIDELASLPTQGRNLIVVLSDTHRLDHVSEFSPEADQPTPHVARLMSAGVAFTDAYTPVPISAPAYATLLTGLSPAEHGLLNNQQHLAPDHRLLQEDLRDAGYRTAAVVANPYCTSGHGFGRGFDHFWDEVEGHGKEGEIVTTQAVRWLESRTDERPFFLFLAYMDAHVPYISDGVPPSLRVEVNDGFVRDARPENAHVEQRYAISLQPGRNVIALSFLDDQRPALPVDAPSPLHVKGLHLESGREIVRAAGIEDVPGTGFERLGNRAELVADNPGAEPVEDALVFRCHRAYRHENIPPFYLDGVRSFDRSFGRLVDHLRATELYDDSIIVFVSDHGEMLGEHGAWGHVEHLYQETLRVPLVIKAPGLAGGRRDSTRIGLAELHDLLLELATGPDPAGVAAAAAGRRAPFIATTFPPEGRRLQVAAIGDGLKAVVDQDGVEQVFDLEVDPGELTDRAPARVNDPTVDQLLAAARVELHRAAATETLDLDALTPDERDRLRALGYLDIEDRER